MTFDLANPHRTINVGVILTGGETEVLDIAPIDLLNGISKEFTQHLPLPAHIKEQALDFTFHWVNEKGDEARLTSGMTLKCTV